MDQYGELYDCFLFRDMEKEKVDSVVRRLDGRIRNYQKNEIVICEEDPVHEMGILLSGEICKVQYSPDGTEQMVQKLQKSYMVGLKIQKIRD